MPPDDPLNEALVLLGDLGARPELVEIVAAARRAVEIERRGEALVLRLRAIVAAATTFAGAADALGEARELRGGDRRPDKAANLPVGADLPDAATIGRQARVEIAHLEQEATGPSPRWRMLTAAADSWTARGHQLGSGPEGRFHRFAAAIGDAAGIGVSHHAIRQLCEKHSKKCAGRIPQLRQATDTRAQTIGDRPCPLPSLPKQSRSSASSSAEPSPRA